MCAANMKCHGTGYGARALCFAAARALAVLAHLLPPLKERRSEVNALAPGAHWVRFVEPEEPEHPAQPPACLRREYEVLREHHRVPDAAAPAGYRFLIFQELAAADRNRLLSTTSWCSPFSRGRKSRSIPQPLQPVCAANMKKNATGRTARWR